MRAGSVAGRQELDLAGLMDYLALTKPRVVVMILLTTIVGFWMASPGGLAAIDLGLLALTLAGTALAGGGTLALNQYLEHEADGLMARTSGRPLPSGRMMPLEALAFGGALTCAGLLILSLLVSAVSGLVTALTVISYLFLYTPLKRRSALCTVVGAVPGALPPVTGWVAAGGALDASAAALFGILFFWQLPHSLAIALLYREDYQRAGMKLLPTVDRDGGSTGRQVVLNCLTLLAAGALPAALGIAGPVYLAAAMAMGLWLLVEGVGLALAGTASSARRLLRATFLYIPVVLLAMAVDKVAP